MLKEERHNYILEVIRKYNRVLSSELSQTLNVSEDTIRRDLRELSDAGKIRRVHGGAISSNNLQTSNSNAYIPLSYKDREEYAHEDKASIALKAVKLIKDDDVIIIDGGTTNLEIVKHLPENLRATFITNSLPVASVLSDYQHIETFFLGGRVLPGVQVSVGIDVIRMLSEIRADICFMGTRSIHPVQGISDIDREEVYVKKAMAESSKSVVSAAISEKLHTIQPFVAIPISRVDTLITNLESDHPDLVAFRHAGIHVI